MSFQTLGSQLDSSEEDYRGKYFLGTVVSNEDPDGLERIKAVIPGLYETEADCVWIGPNKKSLFGVGLGFGAFGVPALGSSVLVTLQDGDPNFPMYEGCILLQGYKTEALAQLFHKDAWGFHDPDHNELVVDLAAHTTKFTSSSGVKFTITATGDLEVEVPKDHKLKVKGNLKAEVGGNASVNCGARPR